MLRRATKAIARIPLRYVIPIPILACAVGLAVYNLFDLNTVVEHGVLLWSFRVLLGASLAAVGLALFMVAPAVLVARLFRAGWRDIGMQGFPLNPRPVRTAA